MWSEIVGASRRWLPIVVIAVTASAMIAAGTSGAGSSPEETVRSSADRALAILADESLSREQKIERLSAMLDDVSDFETTSKLVLARGWRELDETQRSEFQTLLRDYLIARYRSNVDLYAGEKVEVISGREEARGDYTVRTKIDRGNRGAALLVDYRLRKDTAGDWRVIDIIAEGISLVSNLRSQFQAVLSRGGPDQLLKQLREKTSDVSQS